MTQPTPDSDIRAEWAYNGWVLIEGSNGSVQRQVASAADLTAVIVEIERLPWDEARRTAERLWRSRPADAGARMARGRQSMFAATGLSATTVFIVIAAVVAAYVLFVGVIR